MQELKVTRVNADTLVAIDHEGQEFQIEITETVYTQLLQSRQTSLTSSTKIAPRDVQAYIRSGMSAAEVVARTGADMEYVQRFEGPILAERTHTIAKAFEVPFYPNSKHSEDEKLITFGAAINDRLLRLGATNINWSCSKQPQTPWVVSITFIADNIEHEAQWTFEPRKKMLEPLGQSAITLSQPDDTSQSAHVTHLRAITEEPPAAVSEHTSNTARFDSGAFTPEPQTTSSVTSSLTPKIPLPTQNQTQQNHTTEDLLEALRRRRGERDSGSFPFNTTETETTFVPVETEDKQQYTPPTPMVKPKKPSRPSIPSWDELVFGSKDEE